MYSSGARHEVAVVSKWLIILGDKKVDYAALRTLIETHPTHAATSDAGMAVWLNDTDGVTRNRATLPAREILNVALTQVAEYTAMSDVQRQAFTLILSVNENVPIESGEPEREALQLILGSATKSELATRLSENVSRAVDAGFSRIREGDVTVARIA